MKFNSREHASNFLDEFINLRPQEWPEQAHEAWYYLEIYDAGHAAGYAEALTPRPIDEAPKNGSVFIGIEINTIENIISIGEAQFYEENNGFEFCLQANDGDHLTHWLPMPTLPTPTP